MFASRRAIVWAMGLGLLLTLPSVWTGLAVDDYVQRHKVQGGHLMPARNSLDLFSFVNGDLVENQAMMDRGTTPWFTPLRLKMSFWRPLAALTHWIDYQFWPSLPSLMHLENLAWYALAILLAGLLYRRLLPAWAAGLAVFFFAVDNSHGIPVGWIASRNAVMAVSFGLGCLWLHEQWRRDGDRLAAWLAPLALACALLSAEAALATTAYLFAYSLFLDSGSLIKRLSRLLPYAAVVIVWRFVYSHQGYGTFGSDMYVDPGMEPVAFLQLLPQRLMANLGGLFGPLPGEVWMVLQAPLRGWLVAATLLFLTWIAWLMFPLLRADKTARFWALGMLLCLFPIAATEPSNRLFFFAGFGAFGLLAQFIHRWRFDAPAVPPLQTRRSAKGLVVTSVVLHGIVAPLTLPLTAVAFGVFNHQLTATTQAALLPPTIGTKTLVIVNTGRYFGPLVWCYPGFLAPPPASCRALAASGKAVQVTRVDSQTLLVRPEDGFLTDQVSRLVRNRRLPFRPSEKVQLQGMQAEIVSLNAAGRPAEVAFRFDRPLESDTLHWIAYDGERYAPFAVPPVGQSTTLAPVPFP